VAYDDWRQVVRSVIFPRRQPCLVLLLVLHQGRSCAVLSWVVELWRRSSCGFAWPRQCGLVR
jgi:hypothetical protein